MTENEKQDQNDEKYKERMIEKARTRRHKASWSELLILSLLFLGVLFAIYMIEKYK